MGKRTIGYATLGILLALAFAAFAYAKPTTLKSITGADHGDGTAGYSGQITAPKDCKKGRTVKLVSRGAPGAPPSALGSDKTDKQGKFSFDGKAPSELQGVDVSIKKKGADCIGVTLHLTHLEVFGD